MILDITFFLEQVWKSKRKKNRNKYKLIDEYIFIYWNIDNYSSYCYFFFLFIYCSFLSVYFPSWPCRFLSVIRETAQFHLFGNARWTHGCKRGRNGLFKLLFPSRRRDQKETRQHICLHRGKISWKGNSIYCWKVCTNNIPSRSSTFKRNRTFFLALMSLVCNEIPSFMPIIINAL